MIQKYKNHMPQIDESCYIAPGAMVIGNVRIGKDTGIWHNAVLRGDLNRIVVGERTNIQDGALLHCVHNIETIVGNNVTVGHGAILHSCSIGDNSLIGMGAIVLDGAKIGKNCLIGAGALVTPNTEIPDGSMAVGSPAKVKRELTEEEIMGITRNASDYVKLISDYKSSQEE
ncbi:MAG: gamma carbonic anhydrase family protein [Clostridia bacterium]|nr:gamma carbonic anhydrase family protein [Clostridia bacterium]